jgi:hypothetical protein
MSSRSSAASIPHRNADFDRMLPLILAVGGPVVEATDEAHDVGMGARDLQLFEGAAT